MNKKDVMSELKPLTEKELAFILHWGEMGSRWGVNRTVAQIHALLFIRGENFTAEMICELLGIARSNASNSIKELERLGLVKRIHVLNDRKDYFATLGDVWELFRIIARERIEHELKPTEVMLNDLLNDPDFKKESETFQSRTKESAELLNALITLGDQVLLFSAKGLKNVLKAGSGLGKFLFSFQKSEKKQ